MVRKRLMVDQIMHKFREKVVDLSVGCIFSQAYEKLWIVEKMNLYYRWREELRGMQVTDVLTGLLAHPIY